MKIKTDMGFTLVELLMVIVIISILAAVAAPSMQKYLINKKTEDAAREIHDMLQQAKFKAIENGTTSSVTFTQIDSDVGDFSQVVLNDGSADIYRLNIDNKLSTAAPGSVLLTNFTPRGIISTSSASWTVSNSRTNLSYRIAVNIIGNITMRPL